MHSRFRKLASAAAALALMVTPTMAAAQSARPIQPVNPLVAVSLFGTQASAQTICSQGASAATAAGAAAAAQGQAGCVLPARDAPPLISEAGPPPPPPPGTNYGINWILLGLGLLALIGGISTLFDDDDLDEVSPA